MWVRVPPPVPFQSVFGRATVLGMRTRQMQDRVRFEMATIKQMRLKMEEEKENSLSERDKENIKWAVLRAVENGCLDPALIADRCCSAFERINRYGKNTGFGSCGSISTTAPE